MPRDYYDVLGLKKSATEDEIKKAHRSMARKFHPDRNPGDKEAEAKFKEIQEAYDVLSEPAKRQQYDQFGHAGPQPGFGGGGAGPGGFHWSGNFGGSHQDPQEFLHQIFGGGFPGAPKQKGRSRKHAPETTVHEVAIPLELAVKGGKLPIGINGTTVEVKIEPGTEEGKTLRLRGGGPGGVDVHLRIVFEPHPHFRREGNNVVLSVPITLAEAILGAKVEVPTLDGSKLIVTVPAGTSSGARLRLRGKGLAGADQYLEFKIMVPAVVDPAGKALIEEFAKKHPQQPRAGAPWH